MTGLLESVGPALVSTHAAWVESGGSWFACDERPIGSVLTVRFASPVAFTANFSSPLIKPLARRGAERALAGAFRRN